MRGKIVETRPGMITVVVGQVEHTIETDAECAPGDTIEIDPQGDVVRVGANQYDPRGIEILITPEQKEAFSAAWKHATTGIKP